jgi:hypothetical protein
MSNKSPGDQNPARGMAWEEEGIASAYLAKRKLCVLSQNVIHANCAVLQHAQQLFRLRPTHSNDVSFVPLLKIDKGVMLICGSSTLKDDSHLMQYCRTEIVSMSFPEDV